MKLSLWWLGINHEIKYEWKLVFVQEGSDFLYEIETVLQTIIKIHMKEKAEVPKFSYLRNNNPSYSWIANVN